MEKRTQLSGFRHGSVSADQVGSQILVVGIILAGMQAQRRWAVWVGMGVLVVAVVVRLLTRKRKPEEDETDGRSDG